MPSRFPRMFGRGVLLAASATDQAEVPNPKWIQLAYSGTFRGYRGRTIEFTRTLFDTVVVNFRAHPQFSVGADGVGDSNVIHFDYEHASEMDPRGGTIPATGVPAPAWALDLEVRDDENGEAQLWAFAKLGQTIAKQIATDPPEYQWTSVAIDPHFIDPVSGEDIGPTLTSVAFTNDPFLQGGIPIAASMYIDPADSPEEVIVGLREIFGLPAVASTQVIEAQLQKLEDLIVSDGEVAGVSLDDILGALRRLLRLPTLTTTEDAIAAAIASLTYDQKQTPHPDSAATPAEKQMPEITNLTRLLAKILKVNEQDELILAAAEKASVAADAMDTLMGLLGGSDFQSAIANAKILVEKTSGMGEIVAQLAAAMERIGQVDEQDAEAEVDAVVASRLAQMNLSGTAAKFAGDTFRPSILAMRKACNDQDPQVTASNLANFRAAYPLPDADRALLTRRLFAGPNGAQYGLQADAAGQLASVPLAAPLTTPEPPRADGRNGERVTMCVQHEGRNPIEKAVSYLRKERPGFEGLDRGEQIHRASEWLREATA